ncbi:hypothetical protein [Homoserinimonas hongtaonis]|uniref:DUF308 domain-containing protein n=1 Tax=Homoserinimonas hongtaonis TaxID=2079791 RepID=A0A2U1T1W9_9MICO|nr:hypothetical protein [Salinibacterium hongtaonis]PWB97865.1 hypothetical protein DF220_08490 [Salinibacterium hongtaonis]
MSSRQAPAASVHSSGDAAYWPVPIVRAIPALAVGLAITFIADHSASIGLVYFAVFAIASGLVMALFGARRVQDRTTRRIMTGQGIIGIVLGAVALLLLVVATSAAALLAMLAAYAALTGALELYAAQRNRGTAVARDWLTVGAATMLLAIVFVLIPPDSLLAVGLLGAYCVLLGVYLIIAGLSLKWAVTAADTTNSSGQPEPTTGVSP